VDVAIGTRPVPLRGVDAGRPVEEGDRAGTSARILSSCSRLWAGKDFRAAGAQEAQTASESSLWAFPFSKSELLS
jgi:hypothetical protein